MRRVSKTMRMSRAPTCHMTAEGEALLGGMVNAGAVLRRGAVVERPVPPTMLSSALGEHGFDAAPKPVNLTVNGCEQLAFIPGAVVPPPFPRWVMTETALRSVGTLLWRLHGASSAIEVDACVEWPQPLADLMGGTMLCRNVADSYGLSPQNRAELSASSNRTPHPAGPSPLTEMPTVTSSTPRRCPSAVVGNAGTASRGGCRLTTRSSPLPCPTDGRTVPVPEVEMA